MSPRRFTEELDRYTVLRLKLDEYKDSQRSLPAGLHLLDPAKRETVRAQEKELLQRVFEDWNIPYFGKLRGWRADSPVLIVRGDRLIGGVYLCDKNEFDKIPSRGQLHYFFMHPDFRASGIHSVNVREAIHRARAWGLQEIYVNTDRHLLSEAYIRWGAKPVRQIIKRSRLPYNAIGHLVRSARRQVRHALNFLREPH